MVRPVCQPDLPDVHGPNAESTSEGVAHVRRQPRLALVHARESAVGEGSE